MCRTTQIFSERIDVPHDTNISRAYCCAARHKYFQSVLLCRTTQIFPERIVVPHDTNIFPILTHIGIVPLG
jgi:hypothetical protein